VVLVAVLHETFRDGRAVYTLGAEVEVMGKLIAMLMVAGLTACAASAEDTKPPRAIAPPTRIPAPPLNDQPAGQSVPTASIPREVRRAVVEDAAKRFSVPESSVVLTRAEQVTWPDASLGCPEPGTMYTQALVSGFRVVAKTSGGELSYHTDTTGTVRNCRVHEGPDLPRSQDR
jgi:hypothetical protein